MEIAIDYTPAITEIAGIGRYVRELVKALMQIDEDNRYKLFSAVSPFEDATVSFLYQRHHVRMHVLPLGETWLKDMWQNWSSPVSAESLLGQADVFHSTNFVLPPTSSMRRVVTIHDLSFLDYPDYTFPPYMDFLTRFVPYAVYTADSVITVSEYTRQSLLRHFPDLSPQRVVTVPLGVSEYFSGKADNIQAAILVKRFRLKHPLVISVGTLQPRKNYPRLIKAFAEARRIPGGPRHLLIVGKLGWLYEPVFAKIDELGLHESVTIAEDLSDADLIALYSVADVCAQISIDEGFCIPLLEAMRCGTPVIASNGGAIPEVVGEGGLIVPYDDVDAIAHALYRVVSDCTLKHRLVRQGKVRANNFTWQATAINTLKVYQAVGQR